MDWLRIGDRAINLARANLIYYSGPFGVVDDDWLTIEWGEAASELVMTGAEARAAWAAIVAACPNRAPEAALLGPASDATRGRVAWAAGRLAGLLSMHGGVSASALRPVLVQLRAVLDEWGLPAGPAPGEGRGQP